MATIPPALLYLTIYNPTLKPDGPVAPDDEDAEEQAHILFYTARERAVSRDRMLRQIGLAKALVNFSSMFSADEECSHVHSQSRRMIVISPEPDFFIHACLEVARTPRLRTGRSKTADKRKQSAKEKEAPVGGETWYYHDGSVNDAALRTHLEVGYNLFKLTHGTFAFILSNLGHQALELQLERFFTVWAWRWDVEDGFEFGSLLGIPLHPRLDTLQPALDAVGTQIDDEDVHFVLNPPYLLPSARYTDSNIPSSLPRHLLSLFPSPPRPTLPRRSSSKGSTIRPNIARTWTGVTAESAGTPAVEMSSKQAEGGDTSTGAGNEATQSRFLGMPSMNLNMEVIDVRKWNWGALTFGKGPGKRSSAPPQARVPELVQPQGQEGQAQATDSVQNQVTESTGDNQAEEAHQVQVEVHPDEETTQDDSKLPAGEADDSEVEARASTAESLSRTISNDGAAHSEADLAEALASDMSFEPRPPSTFSAEENKDSSTPDVAEPEPAPSEPLEPLPPIFATSVWLDDPDGQMKRRRVLHLTKDNFTFVLVRKDAEDVDEPQRTKIAEIATPLLGTLSSIVKAEEESKTAYEIPSAANILNPRDQHIVLRSDGTSIDGQGFVSKSEHLFSARQLLQQNPNVAEIFSRGQQPQHWHIAQRRQGTVEGDVYLQIMRKETSLPDVDNVLASIGKR